jgi:hypothetical protein
MPRRGSRRRSVAEIESIDRISEREYARGWNDGLDALDVERLASAMTGVVFMEREENRRIARVIAERYRDLPTDERESHE